MSTLLSAIAFLAVLLAPIFRIEASISGSDGTATPSFVMVEVPTSLLQIILSLFG